jgi:hypothetical protein
MAQPTDTEIVEFLEGICSGEIKGDVHINHGLYPIGQGDWCEETLREAVAHEINKLKK